mgnify:CR=1 FL=1|jgi:hypothetical protein
MPLGREELYDTMGGVGDLEQRLGQEMQQRPQANVSGALQGAEGLEELIAQLPSEIIPALITMLQQRMQQQQAPQDPRFDALAGGQPEAGMGGSDLSPQAMQQAMAQLGFQ